MMQRQKVSACAVSTGHILMSVNRTELKNKRLHFVLLFKFCHQSQLIARVSLVFGYYLLYYFRIRHRKVQVPHDYTGNYYYFEFE